MKRIIAILMATLMIMSMAACGASNESVGNNESTESSTPTETTVGQTLLADFKSDSEGTAQEIADRLITNEIIEFMGSAIPVEEGLLSGFDNTEIKGFKEFSTSLSFIIPAITNSFLLLSKHSLTAS